jgi:hypothetical protein
MITSLSMEIDFNIVMTSLPDFESNAPVGSSANIIDGFPTIALAIDTL